VNFKTGEVGGPESSTGGDDGSPPIREFGPAIAHD
jgi:hypothetical protein